MDFASFLNTWFWKEAKNQKKMFAKSLQKKNWTVRHSDCKFFSPLFNFEIDSTRSTCCCCEIFTYSKNAPYLNSKTPITLIETRVTFIFNFIRAHQVSRASYEQIYDCSSWNSLIPLLNLIWLNKRIRRRRCSPIKYVHAETYESSRRIEY